MEHVTSAGAGVALTTPLWIQALNPYVQFVVAVLGGLWLATLIFTKLYTTFRKDKNIVS